MERNCYSQKFGGFWTEEKLRLFTRYLEAYLKALQYQKFHKIYIDAFAGTGEIETKDRDILIPGSVKRALSASKRFDKYIFIEKDPNKVSQLKELIDTKFSYLSDRIYIRCGDANEELQKLAHKYDWIHNRGLLFLDPFATSVEWETLKEIAQTQAIDVWYLFPLAAVNRMMPNNGKIDLNCEKNITRILGSHEWKKEFYKQSREVSLFDSQSEEVTKDANTDQIKEYIIKRLNSIFPCVSQKPRILRNSKNAPMFLFCFAISSTSKKAQKLGLKIANYILDKF